MKADPFWKYTLKEYNYQPSQPNVQFSGWYNVHNSHEAGENVNTWELYPESGIKFTGRGLGRGGESLTIELENRYQEPGVLTLNKFDAITGQGMEEITFDVMVDGNKKDSVTTDKNGIAELSVLLQDDSGNNRVATETYLLRETNVPVGYIDPGDIEIKVDIKDGAFQIVSAKLVDRKAEGSQDGVAAPEDGKIDGKEVLTLRGATSLNIRNFSKSSSLHIKKTWENSQRTCDRSRIPTCRTSIFGYCCRGKSTRKRRMAAKSAPYNTYSCTIWSNGKSKGYRLSCVPRRT